MIAQPLINGNYKLFAGKDIARSGGATAGTLASPSVLAQGEIVITDAGDVILDTTTVLAAPLVKIVMGRGTGVAMWQSQLFGFNDAKSYTGREYQAKVQQVSYYGYNAVANTGAFDVINDNYYTIVISFYELLSQEASSLMNPIVVEYLSTSTATQEAIVVNLYKQLCRQLTYWPKPIILAEMVTSAAGTATNDAGVSLFKGSPTITAPNIVAAPAAVGDFVRIGSQSGDTDEVYKIASISGNNITFTTPFQDDDQTATVYRVTNAAVVAADMGIRVTGINQQFILDSRPVGLVTFQLGLTNGGDTPMATTTTPFLGLGTYELMRQCEATSWRDQGILYAYTEFPPTSIPTDLVSTQNYSVLNISLIKQVGLLAIGEMPAQLEIACALDGNVANTFDTNFTGAATSCVDVLDAFLTQNPALSAQVGNL